MDHYPRKRICKTSSICLSRALNRYGIETLFSTSLRVFIILIHQQLLITGTQLMLSKCIFFVFRLYKTWWCQLGILHHGHRYLFTSDWVGNAFSLVLSAHQWYNLVFKVRLIPFQTFTSYLIYHKSYVNNVPSWLQKSQGHYSLSGKTSNYQIAWSLEATRFDVITIVSLWNLTDIKFQSDWKSLIPNLVAWRLYEILR